MDNDTWKMLNEIAKLLKGMSQNLSELNQRLTAMQISTTWRNAHIRDTNGNPFEPWTDDEIRRRMLLAAEIDLRPDEAGYLLRGIDNGVPIIKTPPEPDAPSERLIL